MLFAGCLRLVKQLPLLFDLVSLTFTGIECLFLVVVDTVIVIVITAVSTGCGGGRGRAIRLSLGKVPPEVPDGPQKLKKWKN